MLAVNLRTRLNTIKVSKKNGCRTVECFCGKKCKHSLIPHMKKDHPHDWKVWGDNFVELRSNGFSYYSIIKKFKTHDGHFLFTSRVVEREVQRLVEEGIKLQIPKKKSIDAWQPKDFHIHRGTFWDFRDRGNWAVHQSDYRGNWSPYIPRTLIKKYTAEEDIVIDPFVGGGTTLIETWLTSRQGFGIDINPLAVTMANSRIQEMFDKSVIESKISLRKDLMPHVVEGNSIELKETLKGFQIDDNSVKLACFHPPYLNALRYTVSIKNDLSHISNPIEFCNKLQMIAKQVFELLTDDGICAILVGDVRRNKEIIPFGFLVMKQFLDADFKLKDIIVKTQHKDSSTRFWYTKKSQIDFLIAHEYLFIFSK